jgi:predicted transcriptional regulator
LLCQLRYGTGRIGGGKGDLQRVAYTMAQTLVYRLEEKGALKKVKKIGNAQLFQPAFDQNQYRSRLVRDLLDLFSGSPRLLVSNLIENGALTLRRDLMTLQGAARGDKNGHSRGAKHA